MIAEKGLSMSREDAYRRAIRMTLRVFFVCAAVYGVASFAGDVLLWLAKRL
jgi:hypothetical protein